VPVAEAGEGVVEQLRRAAEGAGCPRRGRRDEVIADLLAGHVGYRVIQQSHGIGPVLAAVIVAEVGDVTRFTLPEQLCS
jgi:transposase